MNAGLPLCDEDEGRLEPDDVILKVMSGFDLMASGEHRSKQNVVSG